MGTVNQWNDLADSAAETVSRVGDAAEDMAKKADSSKTLRKMRDASEQVEHAVGAHRTANAAWRSFFLTAAGAAGFLSLGLFLTGKRHESLFIGQWVPTLVITALWGQVVKDEAGLNG